MNWTCEKPTMSGYYLHRKSSDYWPDLAYVYNDINGKWKILYHTGSYQNKLVTDVPGQWAGPIEDPEEENT